MFQNKMIPACFLMLIIHCLALSISVEGFPRSRDEVSYSELKPGRSITILNPVFEEDPWSDQEHAIQTRNNKPSSYLLGGALGK